MKNLAVTLGLAVVGFSLVLGGCKPPEPQMFGVPQSQWNTLTPEQKDEVIAGYNQRKNIEQQNAPLNNLVSAARGVAVMDQQRKAMRQHQMVAPPPPGF